ncbi:MAG: prepilin-type N-terminal cleavage/methylation domain-containing protein, partial [Candidatus Kaiserbacteria bacterium]|nr:prepilin-type N-terminal cleavage/methylation domain-containing protein [Candidatus Kaiserbacteria bacterium]
LRHRLGEDRPVLSDKNGRGAAQNQFMNMKGFIPNRGFTLIETMVAITILTLAVSGTFFTANSSMVASSIARDQLTASYFAQEGIELVRQARDNAYLAAPSSFSMSNFFSTFTLNVTTYTPEKTEFSRTITATSISDTEERITSTVTWNYRGIPHSVTITDHLTSWQ